jgi:hypothetical protein
MAAVPSTVNLQGNVRKKPMVQLLDVVSSL